jgi:hypothetical protein
MDRRQSQPVGTLQACARQRGLLGKRVLGVRMRLCKLDKVYSISCFSDQGRLARLGPPVLTCSGPTALLTTSWLEKVSVFRVVTQLWNFDPSGPLTGKPMPHASLYGRLLLPKRPHISHDP